MKIICLKEKYLAGNVYLCTRKACEAAHARQNEQALLPSLNRSFVSQKQINNDDYGNTGITSSRREPC